ncbi:MAG: ribosome maturation factor RimP [Eubacteriales bacterium]|nr:ribosome maturation factor RimP [Eubacteriales bacterium]MDN5364200.1 ribosome maturation factor RimP [Eubacteriales bacterium]
MNKVSRRVMEMAAPLASELGLELVDVEYVKEGGSWILRLFIDKEGGVSHADCQALSEKIDPLLDQEDLIPHSYFLEVSSPGIERPLKKKEDFDRYRGSRVKIKTFAAIGGQKNWTGILMGTEEGNVVLTVDEKRVLIPLDQVASARLAPEF